MYTTSDIYPVSDFNRKTSEHIKRIQETRKPEVLTVNGKAAVVLVDPESYDQLVQNHDLLQTIRNNVWCYDRCGYYHNFSTLGA